MLTLAVLLIFGVAFAVFAVLGPAERSRACEHGRVGDPRCECCPLEGDGSTVTDGRRCAPDGG